MSKTRDATPLLGSGIVQKQFGYVTVTVSPHLGEGIAHVCLALQVAAVDRTHLSRLDILHTCWAEYPEALEVEDLGGIVSTSRENEWLLLEMTGSAELVPAMVDVCRAVLCDGIDPQMLSVAAAKVATRTRDLEHRLKEPAFHAEVQRWAGYYGTVPPTMELPNHQAVPDTTISDIRSLSADLHETGQAHILVVGDADPETVLRSVDQFDTSKTTSVHRGRILTPMAADAPRVIVSGKEEFGAGASTSIRLLSTIGPTSDQRQLLARITSAIILGGTPQSRLSQIFRDQLGIAYDVSAAATRTFGIDTILVNIDVANESAQLAVDELHSVFTEFSRTGPTEVELREAVEFIAGGYDSAWNMVPGRAMFLTTYLTNYVPITDIATIQDVLSDLSCRDIIGAARAISPDMLCGAITGGFESLNIPWSGDAGCSGSPR